jgi:glutathione S-transferase
MAGPQGPEKRQERQRFMSKPYIVFGSEMSPYSVKVRSYFRYKAVPHQWTVRRPENEVEYKKVARLPIVPAVATPDGGALQDSTPIMEYLDTHFPEPSTHPADPALGFLSLLLEEFGDEWGNKLMFHFRWWADVDQIATAQTLARQMLPRGTDEEVQQAAAMIRARMTGRGYFVGSSKETAPLIAGYLDTLLDLLDSHLSTRKYLFGARPSFGDFGVFAQFYEMLNDPTCASLIRARAVHVINWCYRMIEPRNDGEFESWQSLQPTLEPILTYVGRYFLPWSVANAKALQSGAESFTVALAGTEYTQQPQKYHAKSLQILRAKYAAVADNAALNEILTKTGCLAWLQPSQ